MSEVYRYSFKDIKEFMSILTDKYDDLLTEILMFETWKCQAYPNLFSNPSKFNVIPCKYGQPIRIAYSAEEMLKMLAANKAEIDDVKLNAPAEKRDLLLDEIFRRVLVPKSEIVLEKPITLPGHFSSVSEVPIWFNTTLKSVNVRLGFENSDSAKPSAIPLSDTVVHMMLGGKTGMGKSVALNDIICSMLLEYPPWELRLCLADFKIVELSRYANRVATPHVDIVAATSSTEFALSMFDTLISEMTARQALFTSVGVQNLKSFREKFNLVMPRVVLVADEFVQMYENIKISAERGNDKADDQKRRINGCISSIARLGRSQGMHMLLSSQNMDGVLDDQTAGQFSAGATLASEASVSTTLIGNPAGSSLVGKGKAIINLHKAKRDPEDNVLVRVPLLPDSISAKEAAEGKLAYLQQLLLDLYNKAYALSWETEPYYYNEYDSIPAALYSRHLQQAHEYFSSPPLEGTDLRAYKRTTFACIPLGREVAYTSQDCYLLNIHFLKYDNLLLNAKDVITKIRIVKLVYNGLKSYPHADVFCIADNTLFERIDFSRENTCSECDSTGNLPLRYINMVASRKVYLELQEEFTTYGTGAWDDVLAMSHICKSMATREPIDKDALISFCNEQHFDAKTLAELLEQSSSLDTSDSGVLAKPLNKAVIEKFCRTKTTFKTLSNDFKDCIVAQSFKPIVVWWVGADNFEDVKAEKSMLTSYFASCCQVGIFNVVIPSLRCDAITALTSGCNLILEFCDKEFFFDVDLPRNININDDSFQIHNREHRSRTIIRFYAE